MTHVPIDRVMPTALRASKLRGIHLAIVVENNDGDGNPGYRVKLKFPWLADQETTFWARIAVPMGGKERGTYFLPELDDQVLVVFEHGDIDRPIVIGALWSKSQAPVEVNESGNNNTKLIKSRSGHRVIFDDQDGAERITIVDRSKRNKIVLDGAGKLVQIESAGDIEIKASDNVVVHGNALKIGVTEKLTAKAVEALSHTDSIFDVKANGQIAVTGANVMINVNQAAATSVSGSGAGFLGGADSNAAKDQVDDGAERITAHSPPYALTQRIAVPSILGSARSGREPEGIVDEEALVAWQDVLDLVVAGRPSDASCPFCRHRPLTVEEVEHTTRISCPKCGKFIQGRFGA